MWSRGHVAIIGRVVIYVVMCAGDQVRSEVGEELLLSIPSPLSSRFPAQLSTWSGPHYTDQLVSSFIILRFPSPEYHEIMVRAIHTATNSVQ